MGESQIDLTWLIGIVFWLGGGNLIIFLSLTRQKLPWQHMFLPTVISKLQGRDWLALLGLMIFSFVMIIALDK